MKTHKWIVIIVLVLALSMQTLPAHAQGSASIRLTPPFPNPGLVGSDVTFELVIEVANVVPGVAGAEIYLAYNGPVAPPASPMGVAVALPDFFGVSNISINEILPPDDPRCHGSPCIHLVVAGPAQETQTGAAARFHFRCIAVGTANFTVLASTLVDANGFQVPHTLASPVSVPCIFRVPVRGTVLRQGVPANPNLGGGTLACSVVRIEPPVAGPVFTDSSGNFALPGVPPGTYTLLAEYPGYLDSVKTITIIEGGPLTINAGTTTLRGGDVNDFNNVSGDGKINILDIGEIIGEFGTTGAPVGSSIPVDCSKPDEAADVNDDGNINISDLAITAGNWGRIGPTLWP